MKVKLHKPYSSTYVSEVTSKGKPNAITEENIRTWKVLKGEMQSIFSHLMAAGEHHMHA